MFLRPICGSLHDMLVLRPGTDRAVAGSMKICNNFFWPDSFDPHNVKDCDGFMVKIIANNS